jgi:hypothetical protein
VLRLRSADPHEDFGLAGCLNVPWDLEAFRERPGGRGPSVEDSSSCGARVVADPRLVSHALLPKAAFDLMDRAPAGAGVAPPNAPEFSIRDGGSSHRGSSSLGESSDSSTAGSTLGVPSHDVAHADRGLSSS